MDLKKEIELCIFLNEHAFHTFEETDYTKKILIDIGGDRENQLHFEIEKYDFDVWFCPLLNLEPKYVNIPTIATIPDIQHDYFPQYFDKKVLEFRRKNFEDTMNRVDLLFTISEFSKKTMVEKYGIDEDKIKVTYLNADKVFYNDIDEKLNLEIKEKHNLPENYIFYPSNTWGHKNHLNLLKALKIYKIKYREDIKLVLTGDVKKHNKKIQEYLTKNKLVDDVIFLGYLDQIEMPYIYHNARMLVFPSFFEGFCIPAVEAMRINCPIASSDCGSIPEIAADASLIFDPYNPSDIAEKVHELLTDKKLQARLINNGERRSKDFSWEKCADETIMYINNIYDDEEKEMTEFPLISVVTPSYNQGEFIKETIDSVLEQDYPNIEYIVMDGGSTDNTVEILKSYGDKLKWVSEKDEGQADGVNKGIAVAKGEYIGWINSDDTYLEGAITNAVRFLQRHKSVGMVYGEGYYTDKETNVVDRYLTEKFDYNRLAENCIICQPTAFFRKEALDRVGGLNKDLHLCMDYELWMRMAKETEIVYIPKYLATSRMYEENKTLGRRSEVFSEVCDTVKKHYGYVPITWVYGYSDYINDGNKGPRFTFDLIRLFLKYNFSNLRYAVSIAYDIIKKKIKFRRNRDSFTSRYADGWVSKNYINKYLITKKSQELFIEGKHLWPFEDELILKIYLNDVKIDTIKQTDKGEFSKAIKLKDDRFKKDKSVELKIVSNKTFCPQRLGINNDVRNLAFVLDILEIR